MYGGCWNLREAWLDTLRKYRVLNNHFKENRTTSIFDRTVDKDDEDYVLLGLTQEECKPAPEAS